MSIDDPGASPDNPAPLNMEGPVCGAIATTSNGMNLRCTSLAGHQDAGRRWHTDGSRWWYRVAGGSLRWGLVNEGTPDRDALAVTEPVDSTTFADGGFVHRGTRPYVPPPPGILATAVGAALYQLADLPKQDEALARTGLDPLDSGELTVALLRVLVGLQLADAQWKIARGRDVPSRG